MLSVNIPVYNVNVGELVHQITRQAIHAGIDYEIRIYDDCSNAGVKSVNQLLAELPYVVYKEMPFNLGRSAIRNKMGTDSEKKYLLFIDADSKIISENYIESYLKFASPGCVLCGGTSYSPEKPADERELLRWVYGRKREAISAEERNKSKGFIISSNNFLIERKVFLRTLFRENIGPYGHEDTLLGYDLFKQGILPLHINNPVEHIGLEDSMVFVAKTRKALENLLFITGKLGPDANDFSGKVKFLKTYNKLSQICPSFILRLVFRFLKNLMESNLSGSKPSLLWFDLYKVGYFATLKKGK